MGILDHQRGAILGPRSLIARIYIGDHYSLHTKNISCVMLHMKFDQNWQTEFRESVDGGQPHWTLDHCNINTSLEPKSQVN